MSPLKIAQIAPVSERVPPRNYGGTERIVHALTEELVKRGHNVTLFASGDSITSANLVSIYPRSLREARITDPYGPNAITLGNIGIAYDRQKEFDIIHDHTGVYGLPSANIATTPTVVTMHGAFKTYERLIFQKLKKPYIVTISKAQMKPAPELNYIGNVYNGLDMGLYPFSKDNDGYLLFVGRISMEKGIHFAIEVAQYLNIPLIIAAKLDIVDRPYFKEYIEPKLSDDNVKWIGEVDENKRNELMSRALCFLHPITWREPFGLTMIEAMACGCPVIGFNKGSVPEVIRNGETGFVVDDVDEMIDAVKNIHQIDRDHCREYVFQHFNSKLMTDRYEDVYFKVLGKYKKYKEEYRYHSQILQ